MEMMQSLFLSHAHADYRLAAALHQLIEDCFPGHVEVRSSSASPRAGGIGAGHDWLAWIMEQVRQSQFTAVLLTPQSIDKPWLMWEAGAVTGVSLAAQQPATVIPIVYRLSMEQVPSPLRTRQAELGEDEEGMRRVLQTLAAATPHLPRDRFDRLVAAFLPDYLSSVKRLLADTPPPLTESAVHDWLDRIKYYESMNRRSEIAQFHRALVEVFAPGPNGFDTPLDVRLHRRLGDIYLFAKQAKAAAKQYELALRLFPRDAFLLHKQALALLGAGDEPGAEQTLQRLLEIHPDATRWSTEVAGMKGRLHWQTYQRGGARADLLAARDAYAEGLQANPHSHYMADNVGQLSLLLGEAEAATAAFRNALEALARTGDLSYWAMATKATCLFALGQHVEGCTALKEVRAQEPEPAAMDSIRRGLIRLHQGLKAPEQDLNEWLALLDGV